jgi:hypothetical protein
MNFELRLQAISSGGSPSLRFASQLLFAAVCLLSPAVFWLFAYAATATDKMAQAQSWAMCLLLTVGWLGLAYDVRNFAHGKRVYLSPASLVASQDNVYARWFSFLADLLAIGVVLYLASKEFAARVL